ncbi:putative ABC transporter ATP-binding protein YxlF [Phycisphaerae bacterium RAS1]|nr:putative ABC transporter ATP-binding protein YxlF [Phycisphaerae bacterium RAS1]
MLAIETRDLCKHYGRRQVLRGVHLRVPSGSLFGFLGPNGAGKTTLIRILLGLLHPSSGDALLLGKDARRCGPQLRREIGYLPGDVRFYEQLTGRATLAFLDQARGGGTAAEIRRLAERFELDLDRTVRKYSRGMKQKLGLIQALMHRPRLLILDEPTTALDPLVQQTLYDELRAASAEGRTVLFSSHTLAEVEALCDQVAIVRDGVLIEQDRIDVLRARAVRHISAALRSDLNGAAPPDGLHITLHDGRRLSGTWAGEVSPLIRWLASLDVDDVSITPPDLEDLFLAYYSDRGAPR